MKFDKNNIIVSLTKQNGEWQVNEGNDWKKKIPDCAGVWALYGKTKNNTEFLCLEVGQTCNIKNRREIVVNVGLIQTKYGEEIHKGKGIKRQNSKVELEENNLPRRKEKYRHIANNYDELCFVIVSIANEMQDKNTRKGTEKEYASKNNALYWMK